MIDRHVSEPDAFTLTLERDPGLRATVVAIALFDRSPDWERLVGRMERATRLVPTFREKLERTPFGLATPRWVPDPDFDLSWHLRRVRLPAGGDLPELLDLARTAHMAAFDHDRPLWEFTLVEGMADDRAALVLKVHHALTDGIGGIQIAAHVVDLEREPEDLGSAPPALPGTSNLPFASVAEALIHDARRLAELGRAAAAGAPGAALAALRDPIGAASGAAADALSVLKMVRPVIDTRSPVMRGRGSRRHFELLDVPFADLHDAGNELGGSLNDAFLTALAGGLRRYHQRHLACVAQLRVTMPVSMRSEADGEGGNHVTLVRFDLPVGITDPAARLAAVHAVCDAERHEPALNHSDGIATVLNLLPVGVTAGMLRHVDLLASNVPGFDVPVYVGGALVEGFYPFGATLGSAANVTLMSYRGTCNIGIVTDVDAVADPEAFRDCLAEGFAEVVQARRTN
jgi:WS/DGAT/MGAT family acyltransferase